MSFRIKNVFKSAILGLINCFLVISFYNFGLFFGIILEKSL